MTARVCWITVAPVKGMALVHRDEVFVEPFGVRDNRRFHVVGEDGRLLNGKQLGELQQIAVHWDETDSALRFRFPDGSVAEGNVELGEPVTTSFFGRDVHGRLVVGPWWRRSASSSGARSGSSRRTRIVPRSTAAPPA